MRRTAAVLAMLGGALAGALPLKNRLRSPLAAAAALDHSARHMPAALRAAAF